MQAAAVIREMGTGFNLGNTFDLAQHSTRIEDIRPIIDLYQKAGMRHVRIPVTWGSGFKRDTLASGEGKVNTIHPRLSQLAAAVDYALGKGMYVVVNTHHESWLKDGYDGSDAYDRAFARLWEGIATYFKGRSRRLIFEVLNEPEKAFGDWSGRVKPFDPAALELTRRINRVGYGAIRATGGPNAVRTVLVMPNGQGNQSLLARVYPDAKSLPGAGGDPFLAASVHTYDPWPFCGQNGKAAAWPGKAAIQAPIRAVAGHARKLGIGVNYGEFGVGRERDQESRDTDVVREYYRTVRLTALEHGMSVTPWDDRGWFRLVTRDESGGYRFVYEIVPTMMAPGR
ncbi:MAG TPA: cellulase family glycosylhydrolase [Armatimonadaceae bacterium]|nr:cellulase family glycosylhydrolase [Armatimonadaceae bacterium]